MRYCPVPPVTTVRTFSMSAALAASTVTPGSTAPDASLTCPAIDACADADTAHPRSTAKNAASFTSRRIPEPPGENTGSRAGQLRWLPQFQLFDAYGADAVSVVFAAVT